jgi:hypothetical protein
MAMGACLPAASLRPPGPLGCAGGAVPSGNGANARRQKNVLIALSGLWLSKHPDRDKVNLLPVEDLFPTLYKAFYPVCPTPQEPSRPNIGNNKRRREEHVPASKNDIDIGNFDFDAVGPAPVPPATVEFFGKPKETVVVEAVLVIALKAETKIFNDSIKAYALDTASYYAVYKQQIPFLSQLARAVFGVKTQNGGLERKMKPANDIKARAGDKQKFSTLVNEMMIKQEALEERKHRRETRRNMSERTLGARLLQRCLNKAKGVREPKPDEWLEVEVVAEGKARRLSTDGSSSEDSSSSGEDDDEILARLTRDLTTIDIELNE